MNCYPAVCAHSLIPFVAMQFTDEVKWRAAVFCCAQFAAFVSIRFLFAKLGA